MKKNILTFVAGLLLIIGFSACHNSISSGNIYFAVDSATVQTINKTAEPFNSAIARAAEDETPVVKINVELSGAASRKDSKSISAKSDASAVRFEFDDLPLDKSIDVKVTATIGDSIQLYSGEASGIKASETGTAVNVELKKAIEVIEPKITLEAGGEIIKDTGKFRCNNNEKLKVKIENPGNDAYYSIISTKITLKQVGGTTKVETVAGLGEKEFDVNPKLEYTLTTRSSILDFYIGNENVKNLITKQNYPDTDYVIYNTAKKYKLIKQSELETADADADLNTNNSFIDFCFDENGNFIYLYSDYEYFISKNGKNYFFNEVDKTPSHIYYDIDTQKLYVLSVLEEQTLDVYYIATAELTDDSGGSVVLSEEKKLVSSTDYKYFDFAVSENILFVSCSTFDLNADQSKLYNFFIKKFDLTSGTFDFDNAETVNIRECHSDFKVDNAKPSDNFRISDMLIQDDYLYVLARDTAAVNDKLFDAQISPNNYFRGAVVKFNVFDFPNKQPELCGWTSGISAYVIDTVEKDKIANLYGPTSETEKAFFAPDRFVAIKPKKLIISDDGYFYEGFINDENCECIRCNEIDRFVEVDLESFTIETVTKNNTNHIFSSDTSDFCISPIDNSYGNVEQSNSFVDIEINE